MNYKSYYVIVPLFCFEVKDSEILNEELFEGYKIIDSETLNEKYIKEKFTLSNDENKKYEFITNYYYDLIYDTEKPKPGMLVTSRTLSRYVLIKEFCIKENLDNIEKLSMMKKEILILLSYGFNIF